MKFSLENLAMQLPRQCHHRQYLAQIFYILALPAYQQQMHNTSLMDKSVKNNAAAKF